MDVLVQRIHTVVDVGIIDNLYSDDMLSWFTPLTNMEIPAKWKPMTLLFHAVSEPQLSKLKPLMDSTTYFAQYHSIQASEISLLENSFPGWASR